MTSAIDRFVAELRADREFGTHAEPLIAALAAVDLEGDGNPDAAMCYEGVHWIVSQRCPLDERVKALHRLFDRPLGPVVVNLRRDGERIVLTEL